MIEKLPKYQLLMYYSVSTYYSIVILFQGKVTGKIQEQIEHIAVKPREVT